MLPGRYIADLVQKRRKGELDVEKQAPATINLRQPARWIPDVNGQLISWPPESPGMFHDPSTSA